MTKLITNIVLIVLVGIAVSLAWNTVFPPKEVIRDRVIHLSKETLDSLELSVKARVRAEYDARIIPVRTRTVKDIRDSVLAQERLDQLNELRDSLKASGIAVVQLEYRGVIGKYQDSLHVVADFLTDTISVNFSPNPREFTVRDTVETGDSFWTDAKQIGIALGVGAAVGIVITQAK